MKIAIASDHAGFELKKQIKGYLKTEHNCEVIDMGPDSSHSVDYPDYAHPAAASVSNGEVDRAVLICGSGIGMCMTANRYKGVRAAVLRDLNDAEMSRAHNNSNIACLGSRATDFNKAKELIDIWYKTPFEGGRHERRINKIERQ